jgi:hypothetical protein
MFSSFPLDDCSPFLIFYHSLLFLPTRVAFPISLPMEHHTSFHNLYIIEFALNSSALWLVRTLFPVSGTDLLTIPFSSEQGAIIAPLDSI